MYDPPKKEPTRILVYMGAVLADIFRPWLMQEQTPCYVYTHIRGKAQL